jgi:hypothetical protein
MNLWTTTVQCFLFAKRAWQNEERKNVLTCEEIDRIDYTFFELELFINTFNHSPEQFAQLESLQTLLRCLIYKAKRKMGYVPIQVTIQH